MENAIAISAACFVVFVVIFLAFRKGGWIERDQEITQKRKEEHQTEIERIITPHIKTLYAKKLQTVRHDAYGNTFDDAWEVEKDYFHNYVVRPALGQPKFVATGTQEDNYYNQERLYTSWMIENQLQAFQSKSSVQDSDIERFSAYEFEAFCAQKLREDGWVVRTTKGSGDQGVDIVGEKHGWKAVFQVKKYASPVGNKAVQEIIAGKAFESADLAFVISNAKFTPSAIQLAQAANVGILHYTQLNHLTDELEPQGPIQARSKQ